MFVFVTFFRGTRRGDLGIMIVGARVIWDRHKGDRVESTGPGGVEAGGYKHCVGIGGDILGEDFDMLAGHKVESGERSMARKIVKVGGKMS